MVNVPRGRQEPDPNEEGRHKRKADMLGSQPAFSYLIGPTSEKPVVWEVLLFFSPAKAVP